MSTSISEPAPETPPRGRPRGRAAGRVAREGGGDVRTAALATAGAPPPRTVRYPLVATAERLVHNPQPTAKVA